MIKSRQLITFFIITALFVIMIPISAHDAVTYAEWGTVTIDGVKESAWDNAQMIEVKDVALGELDANTATGKIWSLWDGDYLYCYAEITDPIVDSVDKDDAWNQDAVGFMLDFAYDRTPDKNYRDLGADSYAGYINVTPKSADPTKFYPEGPSIYGIDEYVSATKSYTKVVDGGYIIEVAIPLLYKDYSVGDMIGYEICINNGNGAGVREGQTVWMYADGANGSDSWQYTYNMGTLIFNAAIEYADTPEEIIEPSAPVTISATPTPVTASAQTNDNGFGFIHISLMLVLISGTIIFMIRKSAVRK